MVALSTCPGAGSAATSAAAATAAAAGGAAAARPKAVASRCPGATAAVTEAFIAADCAACWGAPADPAAAQPASPRRAAAAAWRLDWITPAGPGADMAAAALPEAAERQARVAAAGTATPAAKASSAPRGWVIEAQSGPAWHQYLGLQFGLRPKPGAAALPAGSTGWLALVEEVPAGTEGTAQARWLVRALAGPLPLAATRPTTHLQAFRMPETSRVDRLVARAWVEAPDGRILWMAADRCAAR